MSVCTGCGQSQGTCSALQSRGVRGKRCCTECSHADAKPTHTPAAERAAVVRYLRSRLPDIIDAYDRQIVEDWMTDIEADEHLKETP